MTPFWEFFSLGGAANRRGGIQPVELRHEVGASEQYEAPDARTVASVAEDEQLINDLLDCLPDAEVHAAVTESLHKTNGDGIRAALGDPQRFAKDFLTAIRRDHTPEAARFLAELEVELRSAATPEEAILSFQGQTVKREVVRVWVDALILAWEELHDAGTGTLELSDRWLLPEGGEQKPGWHTWKRRWERSYDYMVQALPLNASGLKRLSQSFVSEVLRRLANAPKGMAFPDNLWIRRNPSSQKVELVRRPTKGSGRAQRDDSDLPERRP